MFEIKVSGQDLNELKLNLFSVAQAVFNGDFNEPGKSKVELELKLEREGNTFYPREEIRPRAGIKTGTPIVQEEARLETPDLSPKEEATSNLAGTTSKTPARKANKKTVSGESKPKTETRGKLKVPVEKLVEKEDVYVEPEESVQETKETESIAPTPDIVYDQANITAILQKVVAKHGMRAAKTIINSYGATRIGELPQDKYADFANKCLTKLGEEVSADRFDTK